MSQNLRAHPYLRRRALLRLSVLGALALAAVAFGNTGCEDQGIGRPCDVFADAGASQAVYNSEALDCPSRVCLKPIQDNSVSPPSPPTGPLCSASCTQDSDCNGQIRDSKDPLDHRCATGFVCAIPFVRGDLCCKRLCVCKDFLAGGQASVPNACADPTAAAQCNKPSS